MTNSTGYHTHFDLPGICTDAPQPVPGLHPYDASILNAGDLCSIMAATDGASSWCMHFGSTRLVYEGPELSEWLHSMPPETPVYAEHLHPSDLPAWQRPQDMWLLRIDARTGEVSIDAQPGDPWGWQHLTGGADAPDPDDPMLPQARSAALQAAIARRAARTMDDHAALNQARPIAEAAALEHLRTFGPDHGRTHLLHWTTEALDRAYGRARIDRAGVGLDDPEVPGTYGAFYRLGFPPPTHQEMADHILRSHGRSLRQRAARALRRILSVPDTRWLPLEPRAANTATS